MGCGVTDEVYGVVGWIPYPFVMSTRAPAVLINELNLEEGKL